MNFKDFPLTWLKLYWFLHKQKICQFFFSLSTFKYYMYILKYLYEPFKRVFCVQLVMCFLFSMFLYSKTPTLISLFSFHKHTLFFKSWIECVFFSALSTRCCSFSFLNYIPLSISGWSFSLSFTIPKFYPGFPFPLLYLFLQILLGFLPELFNLGSNDLPQFFLFFSRFCCSFFLNFLI